MRGARWLAALFVAALACTGCASQAGLERGTALDRPDEDPRIPLAQLHALEPGAHVRIALSGGEHVQCRIVEVVHDGEEVRALRVRPDVPADRSLTASSDSLASAPREIPLHSIRKLTRVTPGPGILLYLLAAGVIGGAWLLTTLATMN